MQKIGLLGGMSCESTVEYYRIINCKIRELLKGCSSAELIIESFNFEEIRTLQFEGKWNELGQKLAAAAQNLESCGAKYIAICTNLMHKVAPIVEENISVPLIHIVDSVGQEIQKLEIKKAGLLGTCFTMEEDFYSRRLSDKYSIETVIPDKKDREFISNTIYSELCCGIFKEETKNEYLKIIEKMQTEKGIQGIILGCTEIPLIIQQACVPVFDTTQIHARDIVNKMTEKISLKICV